MSVIALFTSHPPVYFACIFLLGLAIGSFLNVVIHRLPRRMEQDWRRDCCTLLNLPAPAEAEAPGLVRPASRCPKCGHAITVLENIPVISWLLLRGRCSACREPISLRYPGVELLTGLLSLAVAMRFGVTPQAVAALLFTWSLVALAGIDLDTRYLYDDITLPLLWLGLLVNVFMLFTGILPALFGAMTGYLVLWLVYHVFRLLTGREGMGYGDFKLLAALGAWNGIQMLPFMLVTASLAGAVIGVTQIATGRRDRSQPMPFGPYLAVAGWIALLWGHQATSAYLSWIGS